MRPPREGHWPVRWRNGAGYRQAPIGTADDAIATGTLDYNAAIRVARAQVEAERAEAKVKSAVESYIAALNARHSRRAGRMVRSDVDNHLSRYVIGRKAGQKREDVSPAPLASMPLHALTEIIYGQGGEICPQS